jgi:hypothetical protein
LAVDFTRAANPAASVAPWAELRERGLVREDGEGVFATEAVMADPAIPALPWPIKGKRG